MNKQRKQAYRKIVNYHISCIPCTQECEGFKFCVFLQRKQELLSNIRFSGIKIPELTSLCKKCLIFYYTDEGCWGCCHEEQ